MLHRLSESCPQTNKKNQNLIRYCFGSDHQIIPTLDPKNDPMAFTLGPASTIPPIGVAVRALVLGLVLTDTIYHYLHDMTLHQHAGSIVSFFANHAEPERNELRGVGKIVGEFEKEKREKDGAGSQVSIAKIGKWFKQTNIPAPARGPRHSGAKGKENITGKST